MLTGFQSTGVLFLSHPPERAHGKPALCPCTHMCSLCTRCQQKHRDILHLDMNTPRALTHLQHHGCNLSPSLGTHSPITVTHLQSTRTVWRQARSSDHSLATLTYGESWQSLASAHTIQLSIIRNFYASKSKDSLSPSFQAWLEQSETVSTIQTMSQHQ